jgi:hypothetical protein
MINFFIRKENTVGVFPWYLERLQRVFDMRDRKLSKRTEQLEILSSEEVPPLGKCFGSFIFLIKKTLVK